MGWVWKQGQAWRGAYRDEAGKEHTKSFKRQIDAKRWVATEEAKSSAATGSTLPLAR